MITLDIFKKSRQTRLHLTSICRKYFTKIHIIRHYIRRTFKKIMKKIIYIMKLNKTLTVSALLAMLPMAGNASTIVYQDTFDDGDISLNTAGIGGGFSQAIGLDQDGLDTGTGFTETGGSINADTSANNSRAFGFSTNTFDLSNGFTLDFTANAAAVGGASANRFSVGLAAAGSDFTTFATDGRNFLGDTRFAHEAVGIDFTADQGQGLSYNDGSGSDAGLATTLLSNEQAITAGTDLDVSLTVAADGSYSYSINGATATTGGDFGLDLSQEYHFATYFQDDVSDNFTISEVTLTALAPVPEPSSTALLGLGGLALILRRKK